MMKLAGENIIDYLDEDAIATARDFSMPKCAAHVDFLLPPKSLAATGVSVPMLSELCARTLLQKGSMQVHELAHTLRLLPSVAMELLESLREKKLVVIVSHTGLDSEISFELTEKGNAYGLRAREKCQYVGPVPVPLAVYESYMNILSTEDNVITQHEIFEAFNDKVIEPDVLEQLGVAMNSKHAILLYGPAGSGKTYLSEQLANVQPKNIFVPYAIEVSGEIIQVFDASTHKAIERDDKIQVDARWQLCTRPTVLTAGELSPEMLELKFDERSKYYKATMDLKANGGILIIDDLGRQRVSTEELLNRWIVPLDRNYNYLSLHTGYKFRVPFNMKIIFSTNLSPSDIADEAFLRRMGYKIYLGALPYSQYRQLFINVCNEKHVSFDEEGFNWLIQNGHSLENRAYLACYPNDLVNRVRDYANYHKIEAVTSVEALKVAWVTYFTGRLTAHVE